MNNFSLDFRRLFELSPGAFLVLLPDLTIAEATDEYLRTMMRRREEIVGREVFEAFPDNPNDETANSVQIRASFLKVFATGEPDELPVQKYDVQRPAEDGGGFEERFWRLVTFPGFDANGAVSYIYQRVENITAQIRAESERKTQENLNIALTARAEKSEAEQRESRQSLALALEAGRAGTFMLDLANDVNIWSPELEAMYGIPAGTFEGNYDGWAKRVLPEDFERTDRQFQEAFDQTIEFIDFEFRVVMPNDELRWFFGRTRLEYDEAKKPLRMIGINVDITDSKRDQELLSERTKLASLSGDIGIALNRHEDLPNLLKHCTDAFVEHLDAVLVRIWTLDASGETLELQASSGIKENLDGKYERIPVGKFMVGKIAERREPYLTNDVANGEDVGKQEWARRENINAFAGYPLIVADKLVGVMAIFSRTLLSETVLEAMKAYANTIANAIERKQIEKSLRRSNQRFQLISRATNDTIWDWNLQTNEVWWNDSVLTMFGYTPDQIEPTADWWYRHIHPEDRERIVTGIHEIIDHGGEKWSDEYRFQCADGSYRYIFDRGFAIHRDDKALRMLGAMLDVTDRKHIETEREFLLVSEKSARAEAEEANRMKDEFLATLSHELRTPLSSILGWSRMLKENQVEGEQAKRAVEIIERNAKSQAQLIEDVLDVSRIISGKMRLEVRPIDLSSVIENAMDAVRPAAEAKNIRLQRVADTNVMISGDADRLQQIIWNLLSNAIKFTPKDGRVQVKTERVNSHVEVVVADNGMGIEPETLPFVFDRFRQSDSTMTRKHGGLGLGLAIVRHLVELHGGTVYAASEGLNTGATFTLTFPLVALRAKEITFAANDQEITREHPTASRDVPFHCPEELKNLRVLVVDDEPDTRDMLLFILESCQANATGVASVDEALKTIARENFDVLISDIGMPERDGYELIKAVRRLAPDVGGRIPAIALTAYARVEDRLKALNSGFQMHIPKPVEPSELIAVVASLANRSKY